MPHLCYNIIKEINQDAAAAAESEEIMKQFKDKYELAAFIQKAVIDKFNLSEAWQQVLPASFYCSEAEQMQIVKEAGYNLDNLLDDLTVDPEYIERFNRI